VNQPIPKSSAHLCNHITAVRSGVAAPSSPSTGLAHRDDTRLASAVRYLRRAEKDLARLAASVRTAPKLPTMPSASSSSAEVKIFGALAEAVGAAVCASATVFSSVEAMSTAVPYEKLPPNRIIPNAVAVDESP
jgi:hypothetical protein